MYFLTIFSSTPDNITVTSSIHFLGMSTFIMELTNLVSTLLHKIKFSLNDIYCSFNICLNSLVIFWNSSTLKIYVLVDIF